jgi:hypothetical protein
MQNSRYIQCDDSCDIKMYSNAIFNNELNNCKLLYCLSYIKYDTKIVDGPKGFSNRFITSLIFLKNNLIQILQPYSRTLA